MNFNKSKMRTITLKIAALFLLLLPVFAYAQPGPPIPKEKEEEIESLKIAFITKKLDLTPDEAKVFWPVYNEYEDKLKDLRQKRRKETKDAKENFDEMTDKEIEALVDGEIAFRQKEFDLQKEYHSKFKSVLPIRKVAKLYQAEEQFKRELLKKMKEVGPPNGPGPKNNKKPGN